MSLNTRGNEADEVMKFHKAAADDAIITASAAARTRLDERRPDQSRSKEMFAAAAADNGEDRATCDVATAVTQISLRRRLGGEFGEMRTR